MGENGKNVSPGDPRYSEIQELILQEAEFLDNGQFSEWLDLMTEDIHYRIPAGLFSRFCGGGGRDRDRGRSGQGPPAPTGVCHGHGLFLSFRKRGLRKKPYHRGWKGIIGSGLSDGGALPEGR